MAVRSEDVPERRRGSTSVAVVCWLCEEEITDRRVIWAHRHGKLRPMHQGCAHPVVRRHGVVIK